MQGCTFKRDVKEACVLCSGKPFALITAGLDQVKQQLTAVALRIGANQGAIDGKICSAGCCAETKTTVRLIRTALLDENFLAKQIDGYLVVARIPWRRGQISKCDRLLPPPLSQQSLGSKPLPRPELHSLLSQQLRKLGVAAGFEQAR